MLVNTRQVHIRYEGICFRMIVSFILILRCCPVVSQDLWHQSEFIETPNSTYQVEIISSEIDLKTIAEELQPKRKKSEIFASEATVNMSYMVYESAAIGKRPFGKIRYKINLKHDQGLLLCNFKDFFFKRIEKNPRYGKSEEVGGKPKEISSIKGQLTDTQWDIIRWKTEVVIERKVAKISSHSLQATGSQ